VQQTSSEVLRVTYTTIYSVHALTGCGVSSTSESYGAEKNNFRAE